ncbi:ABC-type tungstate transport system, periplasmic binding protein [Lachnospiraceae bacterium TWA4]|nr:ABC-type tungstate transport system, periplasmic binding protein [Lachnospiraceae bacterium TWA4]
MKQKNHLLKTIAVLLIIALTSLAFFGCSNTKNTETTKQSEQSKQTEAAVKNEVIRLSTTTSVNDSGLLPYLQSDFEKDTGYKLEITSAGTGAAIEKGRTGDADCLLVHAKASEEEFIKEGYGVERVVLMYNYFVIVGPENDPAGIKSAKTASEAFEKIAKSKSKFVSRGDDSGTNKAELKLWKAINVDPKGEDWYISTGQGMGASINVASEQQAYVFTDKATYLSHSLKDSLSLLLEESEDLKNTYSMIEINPEKWKDTNTAGAKAFIDWMKSDKAKELITNYGKEEYGQQLFYID